MTSTFWNKLFGSGSASIEHGKSPLLKVMAGEIHVADLYHDDKDYCLVYKDGFKHAGLPAFNP